VKSLLKPILIVGGFLVVCCLAAGFRMHRVHDQTGEWRLRPDAAPPTLRVDGHTYARAHRATGRLPWLHDYDKNMDFGGALIYTPDPGVKSTRIQVNVRGQYYTYQQVA
jgi:hypothetical protein